MRREARRRGSALLFAYRKGREFLYFEAYLSKDQRVLFRDAGDGRISAREIIPLIDHYLSKDGPAKYGWTLSVRGASN